MLVGVKHPGLFGPFVDFGSKKFITLAALTIRFSRPVVSWCVCHCQLLLPKTYVCRVEYRKVHLSVAKIVKLFTAVSYDF